MKHFFQQTTEEVLSNLGTTIDGLNDAKVEEQRATYGLSLIHISTLVIYCSGFSNIQVGVSFGVSTFIVRNFKI